jgi:hypothetical protein
MTELQSLRLAVGSHQAGSGKGCAMNVISWENGDTEITDYPQCADPMLARVVQIVNDSYCAHLEPSPFDTGSLLCPPCSQVVLALGHRTVGTKLHGDHEKRTYVRLLLAAAKPEAAHLEGRWLARASDFIAAAEQWLDGATGHDALWAVQQLSGAHGAPMAVRLAETTVHVAAVGGLKHARETLASRVMTDADSTTARLDVAHRLIDDFERAAGIAAAPVADDVIACAVARMQEVAR